ncbi:hypothetical protein GWI33_020014 [Rhynchophorus ferrugineus]|uniref:Myosin motor domain-containing protein n=1 Tax=Rhynchophorus ferrugineus TaxID=354439 RepID=A0A834I479_RHYFE|nr:hypothetical protein GWI33_020014 [Rhynchophorus ferrugineus]
MLNLASNFMNSLRKNDVLSPTPKKRHAQHTGCKGAAHGHGNYNSPESPTEPSPFSRTPSLTRRNPSPAKKPFADVKNGKTTSNDNVSETDSLDSGETKANITKPSPFQRTSSLRGSKGKLLKKPPLLPKPKTASISSENYSESDSIDSSDMKVKHNEETVKKQGDVSCRLFNSVTKASEAKTAKMRHLDIFDVDESGWMSGLRKASDDPATTSQKKKTIINGSETPESPFVRSRNSSTRRSGKFENNNKTETSTGQNHSSAKLMTRNSFRRSFKKNKIKCIGYDEVELISRSRKNAGYFQVTDKANCLKELETFLKQTVDDQAKTEEHLEKEKQWLDAERVWLVHRGGFAVARKEKYSDGEPGKVKIKLEHNGDVLVVDEDDIEKANPPQFDRAEDLAALRHLNESSVLHTLRQRYATNLIHTYAGCSTLLVVNPMAPLAIYSEKVVALFKGCKTEDMPPHIYSMAQSAYHNMLSSRRDQSLIFMGRSGAGKTTNFRHCVQYLVTAAGSVNNILNLEKLTAMWTLLESFGNCKTVMNSNATRFTQIFSVDFDQSGCISSASIQILLLEKSRIARKIESETTFHMIHRLLCGVEGSLRKELFLDNLSGNENNALMSLLQKHEDKQRAQQEFVKTCAALNVLGISEMEQKIIFSVLAAIFHLGCAGAVKAGNNNRYQFANPQCAQKAAALLGTTVEELSRVIFGLASGGMVTPSQPRAPFRTPSPTDKGLEREAVGLEAVEGIVMGLYSEVFNCVANLINRAITSNSHSVNSILLVDTPGFQNPATCGRQAGASFEDLCHNYLQERLQLLFHHSNLVAPKDRYLQENIDFVYDENENENLINPQPLVNLLDKTAQNSVIRTSQTDLHEADRRGLLWLLDEEAIYPGGSDDSFLERLFNHYGERDHQLLLRKAPGNSQFILQHLQGTNPVLYSVKGWLKQSRENPVSRAAVTILQESCKEDTSKLFVAVRGLGASNFSGSVVGLDGSQSLRRASSIRRTFTGGAAAIKRKSICLQTKFTIDGLVETLRRTKLRFVQCILPQHNAGFCESNGSLISVKPNSGTPEDALLNIPLLRSQIRGAQILDSVRLYKQGFPNFLQLGEFRRKFGILAGETKASSPVLDERKAVEDMLMVLDLELSSYRVGLSQIPINSQPIEVLPLGCLVLLFRRLVYN